MSTRPDLTPVFVNNALYNCQTDAAACVLLVGMQAPGNYGPDYKAALDAIYPDLAAQYGVIYAESFFGGLHMESGDPASVRKFMQADGLTSYYYFWRFYFRSVYPVD